MSALGGIDAGTIAAGLTVIFAVIFVLVLYDDWRWHRALKSGQLDNQAAAERSVREAENPHHGGVQ